MSVTGWYSSSEIITVEVLITTLRQKERKRESLALKMEGIPNNSSRGGHKFLTEYSPLNGQQFYH
jgi:hypothetical protein